MAGQALQRVRLLPVKRLRGGFAGIVSAIEAGRLDPLERQPAPDPAFISYTAKEMRARALREHRRARKASKRLPF